MKTANYLNEYLLQCETKQSDFLVNIKGRMEDLEIVDVIGVTEEKGRVYVGLEVEYDEYCYLVSISFMDVWEFVYKDEMIEIQDKLQSLVSSQLKSDLGIKGNMLEDVQFWLKENDENGTIDHKEILNELMYNGVENMAPSHLIYNDDIQAYYEEHKDQINNIIEYEVGYTIDDAIDDIQAFETVTNNIGGIDSELSFEDSYELENSELRFFVWLAFEIVAYDYLKSLEDK